MRNWKVLLVLLMILLGVTACGNEKEGLQFSENILVSFNHGAPGFGTIEDCVDAEIFIYTDRTVKVMVYYPEELEIASFAITEEEYEALAQLAASEKISRLKVKENQDVCDGSSYHIRLYGLDDSSILTKGGYMPEGKTFWEVYDGMKAVLEPYNISAYVIAYRESLADGSTYSQNSVGNDKTVTDEYSILADLLEGEWLCESGSAYLKIYPADAGSAYYKIDIMADSNEHPLSRELNGGVLTELHWESADEITGIEISPDQECAISFYAACGEMAFDGLLIADIEGSYVKFQLIEGEETVYQFTPYEEKLSIERYINTGTTGQMIKRMLNTAEAVDENCRQAAILLADMEVVYLYEQHYTVSETKGVYSIEALACIMEFTGGEYKYSDKTVVFHLDKEGNPLYENIWEIVAE